MKLSIIIIHYKTADLTFRCLESIEGCDLDNTEIIVVDNDSQDGAQDKICSTFPHVNWVTNKSNEGFGRANNLGASSANGEYLLFLNSDMLIPKGCIEVCFEKMGYDSSIGVLGPRLLNEDETLQKSIYHYIGDHAEMLKSNLLLDKLISFKEPEIKAVMGSFMMIPKKVFEAVGGFDPDFFMYCEELELCERISDLAYKIVYFEETFAIHKHGGSSNGSGWSSRQTYLSRALLVYKVKGLFGYALYHWIMLFNTITNFLLMWFLDPAYRKDYFMIQKAYYSNWLNYWRIPFKFTRKLGNGKEQLRSA